MQTTTAMADRQPGSAVGQALLVLAETLEVPLRERNRLLEAGGYAHIHRQTPLAAEEMAHIRGVLQFILDRHKPYASAVVLDRYSNCLMGNGASEQLAAALVDASLLAEHMNSLRLLFHPLGVRSFQPTSRRNVCGDA